MQLSGKTRDGACPHRCGDSDLASESALLSLAGSSQDHQARESQHALPVGGADTQVVLDDDQDLDLDEQPLLT